jgi:hypothetical protein
MVNPNSWYAFTFGLRECKTLLKYHIRNKIKDLLLTMSQADDDEPAFADIDESRTHGTEPGLLDRLEEQAASLPEATIYPPFLDRQLWPFLDSQQLASVAQPPSDIQQQQQGFNHAPPGFQQQQQQPAFHHAPSGLQQQQQQQQPAFHHTPPGYQPQRFYQLQPGFQQQQQQQQPAFYQPPPGYQPQHFYQPQPSFQQEPPRFYQPPSGFHHQYACHQQLSVHPNLDQRLNEYLDQYSFANRSGRAPQPENEERVGI